ncbi:hypothetical protein RhiirA4_432510 [Rhizophagus irregularis]|uniref:Uncharacterized protein n=1 Tax=Rhizophagus irregularis TaxID=588596 RepID=A0A2I1HU63_9GLOM|nr:hypothetical protein RhiirA4_432510 [Rhizophagus irregularis]
MRYFKEVLHLEENIAEEENREKVRKFQKSITYRWWNGNKYPQLWINDDITDMIIKKIVETKGFVEEYGEVGELESSDDAGESNSNKGDEHIERIYKNYWLENGYEINVEEIRRIINFGIENEIMKTKDFIENYMTIKELDDEGVIKELKRWYSTNAMECPLCNRMILTREAAGIIDSEESGEKSDNEESEEDNIDDSEKVGEILDPEEYEIWEENTKDFNENEFENNNENVINTEGFGSSQNSDSNNSLNIKDSNIENSDTKSELSDYNLQDLFQENILLNMGATLDEMRNLFRTFVQNQYGNDLENDLGTPNPNLVNNALGNINATRGLVVEFPLFGGSENEDAENGYKDLEMLTQQML